MAHAAAHPLAAGGSAAFRRRDRLAADSDPRPERNLLTQIFRFFTQADVEVNNCYMKHYARVFEPTEVQMMLAAFSNIETVHIAAYSHLLDTVGMPEVEYSAFMRYKAMRDKYDYMKQFGSDSKEDIARTLAVFGAFTEGVQLFASFAILLNFPRFGKMKGMGQIVAWSARDETLHTENAIRLFPHFRRGISRSLDGGAAPRAGRGLPDGHRP